MDNSILTSLATINATILSIIFAGLLIYFFYSYQVLSQLKENLGDWRIKTAQTMSLTIYYKVGIINFGDYMKEGKPDLKKIRDELHDVSPISLPDEIQKQLFNAGVLESPEIQIKQKTGKLLDFINLLSISYPYAERSSIDQKSVKFSFESKRVEYDANWKNDLMSLNGYLTWLWQGRQSEIMKLISDYKALYDKDMFEKFNKDKQKMIDDMKKAGRHMTEAEAEERLSPFKHDIDFNKIVLDFFNRVLIVESKIVPEIKELSYKLDFFENKFKIKKYMTITLSVAAVMLILGTFLPLFIHLYYKPPFIKELEVVLLVLTIMPYFLILLFFLKKSLGLEFK